MFPSDRETIDDYAVALVKSVFHGNSNDVIRAKNISIEAESPDDNSNYEENKAQDIFCERMFFKQIDANVVIIHNNYFTIVS